MGGPSMDEVTIYYRVGDYACTGIFREELKLEYAFTFSSMGAVQELIRDPNAWLEQVFELLNRGRGVPTPLLPSSARSMCAGDVVAVGEVAYYCASMGWEPIGSEELAEALERGWAWDVVNG